MEKISGMLRSLREASYLVSHALPMSAEALAAKLHVPINRSALVIFKGGTSVYIRT